MRSAFGSETCRSRRNGSSPRSSKTSSPYLLRITRSVLRGLLEGGVGASHRRDHLEHRAAELRLVAAHEERVGARDRLARRRRPAALGHQILRVLPPKSPTMPTMIR